MYPKNYDANSFVCKAGKRFKAIYKGVVSENGFIDLIEVGQDDLWELHNADAESCDINNIIERFASGDVSALTKVQGSYLDIAGLPKDLRGMSELIDSLRSGYNSLDSEVKERFNSFNEWLEQAGSDSWIKKMSVDARPNENNNEKNDNSN